MSTERTSETQDIDIEIEMKFLVLPTEKDSHDLKGKKASFYKKQERLNAASKAPNDRIIEEAILLSANKPTSRAISDQNSKEATEICRKDQESYLNRNISILHNQSQQGSLKTNSSGLRGHLFALKFEINSFNSLQKLDFTRCLLGKHAIQALCFNYDLKSLKSLILTQNPIRNEGVEFLSEISNWPKLQTLILCNIQIDYDRVKWLAMNESWTSLRELDLSENPLIGDLKATSVCLNRPLARLKSLSLWSCNAGTLGIVASRRRWNYEVLFTKDETTKEAENQNSSFKKIYFRTTRDTQYPEKRLQAYLFASSNLCRQDSKAQLRGGATQDKDDDNSSGIDYSGLLSKFQQYKEKF